MKKLVGLVFPLFLFGYDLPYFLSDTHGYLPKEQFGFGLYYAKMNDTIDVFNMKESELGSGALGESGLGDLDGMGAFGRMRLGERTMLGVDYRSFDIAYGQRELGNKRVEAYIRRNILSDVFAMDVGYVGNRASDLMASGLSPSSAMIESVVSGHGIEIVPSDTTNIFGDFYCDPSASSHCLLWEQSDGSILAEGTDYSSLAQAAQAKDIDFSARSKNLKDDSYFIRFLRSFIYDLDTVDLFVEYRMTKVSTDIEGSAQYQSFSFSDTQSLSRKESRLSLGANYSTFANGWLLDAGYEFSYTFRESGLKSFPTNHKLYLNLGYKIYADLIFFVGAQVMSNQFNGEIPYLYNEYSQSSFDKKYGWVKSGLMIGF